MPAARWRPCTSRRTAHRRRERRRASCRAKQFRRSYPRRRTGGEQFGGQLQINLCQRLRRAIGECFDDGFIERFGPLVEITRTFEAAARAAVTHDEKARRCRQVRPRGHRLAVPPDRDIGRRRRKRTPDSNHAPTKRQRHRLPVSRRIPVRSLASHERAVGTEHQQRVRSRPISRSMALVHAERND